MSVRFPQTVAEVFLSDGQLRSGGTDLQDRRHRGLASGDLIDLRDLRFGGIQLIDGRLRIGASVRISALAEHPAAHPWGALVEAAQNLATPQIRRQATVVGNLFQEVRCPYFRSPDLRCLKKGGSTCLARAGDSDRHSLFRDTPCIAPHPSTLAAALLAYDVELGLDGGDTIPLQEALADQQNPEKTHSLPPGRLVEFIEVAASSIGEGTSYHRITDRAYAEWPLVEVAVRVSANDSEITGLRVVVGGVANRPLDLSDALSSLQGKRMADLDDLVPSLVAAPEHDKRALLWQGIVDGIQTAWSRAGGGR